MANIDDIRKAFIEYDFINPILTYEGDLALTDVREPNYDSRKDLFYLNAMEDKRKGNLFSAFQDKYFYNPLEEGIANPLSRDYLKPVLHITSNKNGDGRNMCFDYFYSILNVFDDKYYCMDKLECIKAKNGVLNNDGIIELLDDCISYYKDIEFCLDDFLKKKTLSKYSDKVIDYALKAGNVSFGGVVKKSYKELTPIEKNKFVSSLEFSLGQIIKSANRQKMGVLENIKTQLQLKDERETGEYQKQMVKDFYDCFSFDKLILCIMKQIIDNQSYCNTTGKGVDNSVFEITNYLHIIDQCKNVKYNPSIKYYDSKKRKVEHYNVNDLRNDYNRLKKKYPELLSGEEIDLDQLKDLGIDRNIQKLNDYQEFRKNLNTSVFSTQWDLLPSGQRAEEKHTYGRSRTNNKNNDIKEEKNQSEKRGFTLSRIKNCSLIVGKDKFEGYIGYLYENGLVVFEKYDSTKIENNATYIMDVFNFQELCQLSKPEIIEYIKSTDNKKVRRLYHNETWEERIISLVNSFDTTEDTIMAVKALVGTLGPAENTMIPETKGVNKKK